MKMFVSMLAWAALACAPGQALAQDAKADQAEARQFDEALSRWAGAQAKLATARADALLEQKRCKARVEGLARSWGERFERADAEEVEALKKSLEAATLAAAGRRLGWQWESDGRGDRGWLLKGRVKEGSGPEQLDRLGELVQFQPPKGWAIERRGAAWLARKTRASASEVARGWAELESVLRDSAEATSEALGDGLQEAKAHEREALETMKRLRPLSWDARIEEARKKMEQAGQPHEGAAVDCGREAQALARRMMNSFGG